MLRPVCETSHFTEWHIFLSFREMDNPIVHFMKWAKNEFETCHSMKMGTLIFFIPRYGASKILMNKVLEKHLKLPVIWGRNHVGTLENDLTFFINLQFFFIFFVILQFFF